MNKNSTRDGIKRLPRPYLRELCAVFAVLFATSLYGEAEHGESNEAVIKGSPKERRELRRPGQSIIVKPSEETRFDFENQVKADPSIVSSSQGRSSGFSLPLFRGQDARSTHVFIEDVELHDPFSGLPLVDEIDLRAFGALTIHKGFAPWDISVMEPGGVIQFSKRPSTTLGIKGSLGAGHGDVQGTGGWGRGEYKGEEIETSIYARRSFTKGNYAVYNDQGTVLNPNDDSISRRSNNDRSSTQSLLTFDWSNRDIDSKSLLWSQLSRHGVPTIDAQERNFAHSKNSTNAGTSTFLYSIGDSARLGINIGFFQANRQFNDPTSSIGFATKRTLATQSIKIKSFYKYEQDHFGMLIAIDQANTQSTLNSTYQNDIFSPNSKTTRGFIGTKIKPEPRQIIEAKANIEASSYNIKSATLASIPENDFMTRVQGRDDAPLAAAKDPPTSSQSLAWSIELDTLTAYAQFGQSRRFPSLLERLGNGAEIEGAANIHPERSLASEIGLKYALNSWTFPIKFASTLWGRDNDDVIRVERVSANRWRARNVKRQIYRGIETRGEIEVDRASLEFAVSAIQATQGRGKLLVPRVPIWQAAGGVTLKATSDLSIRALSRFSGRMYDDYSNTREIGWSLVHDMSVDYVYAKIQLRAGLSVHNITNHLSNNVIDTATHQQDGRIAHTSYSGEPLSGRSYLASVSLSL